VGFSLDFQTGSKVGDQWYRFSDDDVRLFANEDEVINHQAYIIFLVRRSAETIKAIDGLPGGVCSNQHRTTWLRQQSITMPELWPHLAWAKTSSGIADILEEASRKSKTSPSLGAPSHAMGYVLALPEVLPEDVVQTPDTVETPGSSSSCREQTCW
ncbi:unnamed protein product, partial [Polarella glacialis]